MARRHWLMKSEPGVYSIEDLEREGTTSWEGIRNYQARNFLRDDVQQGDLVLFYHSNAEPPGVAGVAKVTRAAYPDHFAWKGDGRYRDPRSTPEDPVWFMVDVGFVERFDEVVSLEELKSDPELEGMLVTQRGQRLSVQPVDAAHFRRVRKLGRSRTRKQPRPAS